MTTTKILLVAGSAALLANFALAQQAPAQPDPSAQGPGAEQQQPAPAPPPPPQNGNWRRFSGPQQTGNETPNTTPPYYPQGGQIPPPQPGPNNAYPPPTMAAPPTSMTLPAGTWLKVHIDRVLSSDHNHQGDMFTGTLAQPLIVNGYVIAHRGQNISGRVTSATKAGRVKGTSELALEISEVAVADGQQLPLKTSMVEYHGPTSRGRDAAAIGGTTLLGAAIGGAVNGGVGAGVGAAAGLVTSTIGVLVTRGHPTIIFPESLLTFKTSEAVTFSTERSAYAFQPAGPQDYAPAMQSRSMMGPRPYYRPYGPYYGYPYPYYGYPYPFFGGGLYIRGGYFGRRW